MINSFKKQPCFNVVARAVEEAFNPRLLKGEASLSTEQRLHFLKGHVVQAFCDCTDNFEHGKLVYEFKRRAGQKIENKTADDVAYEKKQARKMRSLESRLTNRKIARDENRLTNCEEIKRYIETGQILRKLDLLSFEEQSLGSYNFT